VVRVLTPIEDIDEGIAEQIPGKEKENDWTGARDEQVRVLLEESGSVHVTDEVSETGGGFIYAQAEVA
jgi:hypothetical protein